MSIKITADNTDLPILHIDKMRTVGFGAQRSLTVYIGRFSPLHIGHVEVLKRALKLSERVLVIVGSADQPRTIKNPWTAQERAGMIRAWYEKFKSDSFIPADISQLIVVTNKDYRYNNNLWLKSIQEKIQAVEPDGKRVWLTGADRDKTTWYLTEFSASYNMDLVEEHKDVSLFLTATMVREIYFGRVFNHTPIGPKDFDLLMRSFVPTTTLDFLTRFQFVPSANHDFTAEVQWPFYTKEYADLLDQYNIIKKRKEGKRRADGYAIIDFTGDSVVVQTGHILLIKRRSHPGKGLWALPGGYLNETEWSLDGALRELEEETKVKVPPAILRSSLTSEHWFEHPDRSELGRTITHAFYFKLPDFVEDGKISLPKIKGSDDAEKARWFSFSEVETMSSQLFDDHYDIIRHFLTQEQR